MKHTQAPVVTRRSHAARLAFVFVVLCAAVLWALDALRLSGEAQAAPAQLLLGLGVALFRVLVAALVVAALASALTWLGLSAPPSAGSMSARLGLARWFAEHGAEQTRVRAARMLSLTLAMAVYLAATRASAEQLIVHMARPSFAALAIMASQLLITLGLVALSVPLRALGVALVAAAHRVPRLGAWLFGSPLRCLSFIAACGLTGCIALVLQYRQALGYLPWSSIGHGSAAASIAILGSASALRVSKVAPQWLRLTLASLALGAVAAAILAAVTIGPCDLGAHDIADRKLSSARVALDILRVLSDFDRDGHLSLVGGDCAAFDAEVHPGAMDIPGNGRDEDCDGSDALPGSFVLSSAAYLEVPADVPSRPPILLVTIDAFAASHMGSFGYARNVTPKLDALARRGALFRSCYAQGPSTRLSFPSLFTSRWDSQIQRVLSGRHPFPVRDSEQMLAELVRDAGYETTAILADPYFTPERWRGLTDGFTTLTRSALDGTPHNAGAVTDAAIAALHVPGERPKFLWVHYFDAHPEHLQPDGVARYGETDRDRYDAELTLIDRELGRLVEHVDALYAGQAVVMITGDHGIDFDEPRHDNERYGYDLSSAVLHVPLIVLAPFVAARRLDHVVSTMDITPTLINLLRLQPARALYGASLLPELLSGAAQRQSLTFHQMFLLERAWRRDDPLALVSVRTDRFNLIHDRQRDLYELYDYRDDPLEAHDLTLSPPFSQTFASLKGVLQEFTYAVHRSEGQAAVALP